MAGSRSGTTEQHMTATAEKVNAEMFGDNPPAGHHDGGGRYSPSLSATRSRWPDLTTPVSMMLDRSPVRSLRRLQVHGLLAMAGPSVSQVPDVSTTSRCL